MLLSLLLLLLSLNFDLKVSFSTAHGFSLLVSSLNQPVASRNHWLQAVNHSHQPYSHFVTLLVCSHASSSTLELVCLLVPTSSPPSFLPWPASPIRNRTCPPKGGTSKSAMFLCWDLNQGKVFYLLNSIQVADLPDASFGSHARGMCERLTWLTLVDKSTMQTRALLQRR